MYKTFILILFILSIIYISASIAKHIGEKNTKYAEAKIIYKYIPRPLPENKDEQEIQEIQEKQENQENQLIVSEVLASMFYIPPKLLYKNEDEQINNKTNNKMNSRALNIR